MLGTKLGSFTRAVVTLDCRPILPALTLIFECLKSCLQGTKSHLRYFKINICLSANILTVCLVFMEAQRGDWMPWNWTCKQLWVTMKGPGIEPKSFRRTVIAFKSWAISSAWYNLPTYFYITVANVGGALLYLYSWSKLIRSFPFL